MTSIGKYIRFDWAMKHILREKANFDIIEGLLTTLLGEKITIQKMLESESNQETAEVKQNRVDMLAEGKDGALYLIEVQNNSDVAYFQRMLFGTSRLIADFLHHGEGYEKIRKIYSINIVYFQLGNGIDYVYHGTTEFRGIHKGDTLNLSRYQMQRFHADKVSTLFPEYYILKVNDFNHYAETPLEEWITFLRTGNIADNTSAPGLLQARQKLKVMSMTDTERRKYYNEIDDIIAMQNNIETERNEGRAEGRAEIIKTMYDNGISIERIAQMTNISIDEATIIVQSANTRQQ